VIELEQPEGNYIFTISYANRTWAAL